MQSTVLIVDDNVSNLRLLEKLLKSKQYSVCIAHNGAEALDMARKAPPNLIISDILMPVMDGFMLCQQWNSDPQLKNIPFVFYTATYTDRRDEQLALNMGAARFIVKPVEPDIFIQIIQDVIDELNRKQVVTPEPVFKDEEVFLNNYNQALVRKLEQKVEELKNINLALENEISQRKTVEKALRESEEKLKRVFSAIAGGIIITDLQGNIIDCNENTYRIIQRDTKDSLLGKNIFFFLDEEEKDRASANLKKTIEKGASYDNEYTITRADGTKFPIEVSSCIARDWADKPLFIVINFADITDRKNLQYRILELYEKEKLQREELQEEANARGQFIDVLAHELRTPLTPIMASSDMLKDIFETNPVNIQKRLCYNINNGARILVSRLEELLDLASFDRGTYKLQFQKTDVNKLLNEVIVEFQPVLEQNMQQIDMAIASNPGCVESDITRLKQVFTNLLSNASKFSPQHSIITLRVKTEDGNLLIEVSDTGSGISYEEQTRLFQPYHRVEQDRQKFPGIGLGLAISKQIIEAHGGRIWIESQPGNGSTFSFSIPLARE
ncbi:MAG: response regulator [Dehalococcoidales bacterium]|nr:response regulator [Dehalococcoidales bacterium]